MAVASLQGCRISDAKQRDPEEESPNKSGHPQEINESAVAGTDWDNSSNSPKTTEKTIISKEILDADMYSNVLQIGNTIFTKPPGFNDFISSGAQLMSEKLTEDSLIQPHGCEYLDMQIGKTSFRLQLQNTSNEVCPIKEATVLGLNIRRGSDIIFPKGITIESPVSELTEKWGAPDKETQASNIYKGFFTYSELPIALDRVDKRENLRKSFMLSSTGFFYAVSLSPERKTKSKVSYITVSWVDKTQPVFTTVDLAESIYVEFEEFELSCTMPYSIAQNMSFGNVGLSLYEINNTLYVIVLDFPASFENGYYTGKIQNEFTKETLDEYINDTMNDYRLPAEQYTIENIEVNGANKIAISYLSRDNELSCRTVFMSKYHTYTTTECRIIPLNENDTISDAAIATFKSIMLDYMCSFREAIK
jgi:hypothetical protein